jgi:hypothetical protein
MQRNAIATITSEITVILITLLVVRATRSPKVWYCMVVGIFPKIKNNLKLYLNNFREVQNFPEVVRN